MRVESTDPPASPLARFFLQEDLNFLVTNRLPRRFATRLFGWYSRIESRRLTRASIRVWSWFADDLRLHEARETDFDSLHACFTRALRDGARPVCADPDVIVSPCDAEVGAHGRVVGGQVFQAKGFPYALADLLGDPSLERAHRGSRFVTLRLKSNMYHRFHAPCDARLERVAYVSGDTWNVNPIALRRVEQLFCKNERAVLTLRTRQGEALAMVPVASILVASLRLHHLPVSLNLTHRGRQEFVVNADVRRGEELGYFESGSTIVLFVDGRFSFCEGIAEGATLRQGQALLRRSPPPTTESTPT